MDTFKRYNNFLLKIRVYVQSKTELRAITDWDSVSVHTMAYWLLDFVETTSLVHG